MIAFFLFLSFRLRLFEFLSVDARAGSSSCCRICLDGEDGVEKLISPCMCKGTQQFVHRSCLDHWRSVKEVFSFSHCTTCHAQFHLRIQFRPSVMRGVLLVFLAVQTAIGAFAYLIDKDGALKTMFNDGWYHILSKHPIPFYYCIGVVTFFLLLAICGVILFIFAICWYLNSREWGIPDYSPFAASMIACSIFVIFSIVIYAIFGIASDSLGHCLGETLGRVVYWFSIFFNAPGFQSVTAVLQRIWQKDDCILTKRDLTKEYIVEDMHGCYTPPKLDPKLEERLKMFKLL